jgi:hypothetical protein
MKTSSNPIIAQAKEKVKGEFENLPSSIGNKEKAVSSYVHNVISDACDQSEQFSRVVYDFKRTLGDCLKEIMKGVGSSISDIDVYRNAIQFYFPNSEIHATTTITFTGEPPSEEEIHKAPAPEKKSRKPREEKPRIMGVNELTGDRADEFSKPTKTAKPTKKKPAEESGAIQLSLF